jgi:hypothetical protein
MGPIHYVFWLLLSGCEGVLPYEWSSVEIEGSHWCPFHSNQRRRQTLANHQRRKCALKRVQNSVQLHFRPGMCVLWPMMFLATRFLASFSEHRECPRHSFFYSENGCFSFAGAM